MERTKEYSVVNDTLKALKNQGLSERYFQKGHSFSSQARYDHFDTSPNNKYNMYAIFKVRSHDCKCCPFDHSGNSLCMNL